MKRTESERVCSANGCVDFCSVFMSHVPVFHLEFISPLILKVSCFLSSLSFSLVDPLAFFVYTAPLCTLLTLSHVKMIVFMSFLSSVDPFPVESGS